MTPNTKIELLCPAKDLLTAIAAIDHGADAIYIGAYDFGARSSASNSIEDIKKAVDYAHKYRVRVYVTLNTIIPEGQLIPVQQLIHQLYQIGVDAVIVQDMAILQMELPPIELHSSTQTDNRTSEKVDFLHQAGFSRVVLARELTLEQIADIHSKTEAKLEIFIHGALCVSYSGACYMSHAFCSRSANKGECAQICRLPYDLVDAQDKTLAKHSHLLSLKDLDQSSHLEKLIDAGATSLKIEGRLKDVSYVKNITAYYRGELDRIFARRKDLQRSSDGVSRITFEPDPKRSFNRGSTNFHIDGRPQDPIHNPHTPKSIGQEIGQVVEVFQRYIKVHSSCELSNADGFCFIDREGKLQGFRIDKAMGSLIYPTSMPSVSVGTILYRNYDHAFEKALSGNTATRSINIHIAIGETQNGLILNIADEYGFSLDVEREIALQDAQKPQNDNIKSNLSKTGRSEFIVQSVNIHTKGERFIPSSILADMRREAVERLSTLRSQSTLSQRKVIPVSHPTLGQKSLDFTANVYNSLAREFYRQCGVDNIEPAFETKEIEGACIATSKHCIKHSLEVCPKNGKFEDKFTEPLYLQSGKIRMRLEFDCANCQMKMYKA